MSTSIIAYILYMSTWTSDSDEDIQKVLDEHSLFQNLGDYDAEQAIKDVFSRLTDLAMTVRNETIAADAIQISADAAAVASIWSFGLGMIAFAGLEATRQVLLAFISKKREDLDKALTTADSDIAGKISNNVNLYIAAYKQNNNFIASKAPVGLDTRTCRALLMQFIAEVQKHHNGNITVALFRQGAESARLLYESSEINNVYNAFDALNLSAKTDQDIQQFMSAIHGFTIPGAASVALSLVRGGAISFMSHKLNIAREDIKRNAAAAEFEVAEVETSALEATDAVGKVATAIAVVMSVVDVVLNILDIRDVVEQCQEMCDKLDGPIKASYISYFGGIKEASKAYNAAIIAASPGPNSQLPGAMPNPRPSGPTVNFQLSLDLNQAMEPALNVPSRANVPSLWANLTTNAKQREPGEFNNGIWAREPNVFGLHNAGANVGSAQRFAYIGMASQDPFTMTQVQVQVDTNAQGSSAANPVLIAVEWALTDAFTDYTTLGTVQSNHTGPQRLAVYQHVPAGLSYIRLRATSTIPDGSNFIAYSNLAIGGFVQKSIISSLGSISVLDSHAQNSLATSASFQWRFDLKNTSINALLVGSTIPAQSGLFSLLATNAFQWEPGEFNNGVTAFDTKKVFILHKSGAAMGSNQRYLYAVIATQQALVVSAITISVESNARGSSPSAPVTISIDSSTSLDFANAVTLGSVSTRTTLCATNARLPAGVSYLRSLSSTPIPDDSNYIAFGDISITCSKVQAG